MKFEIKQIFPPLPPVLPFNLSSFPHLLKLQEITSRIFVSLSTAPAIMLEALLSLSGLTLLSTSVLTSWSTSLNLLFFYLTWSTLILSQAPLKIEVLGTLAIRLIFFWVPSLLFLLFDTLLPSLSQDFKIRGAAALPNPRKSWKIVAWAMFNMLLGVGIQAAVETFLIDGIHWKSALRVSNALPMPGLVALDLFRAFLLREVSIELSRQTCGYIHVGRCTH